MKKMIVLRFVILTMAMVLLYPESLFAQQDSLKSKETKEVEIQETRSSFSTDHKSATMSNLIGKGEFMKAACCNLSESFEANPSVDVNFTDAVTGARQIQMLGLTGNYTSIQTENIPEIRLLNSSLGLGFIPGPWINSIQITKGPGSVINGFESMAGALNIEQQKPDGKETFLLNGYVNQMGRSEGNINWAKMLNPNLSTSTMIHADTWQKQFDRNGDGFMDAAMNRTFSLNHRWKYITEKFIYQAGVKMVHDTRWGGQMNFTPEKGGSSTLYGTSLNYRQVQGWSKIGYVFAGAPYKSIGLISSFNWQESKNYFGTRAYNAVQRSVYLNGIYQDILGNTTNSYKTGISFQSDYVAERLFKDAYDTMMRTEQVVGVFYEHTYVPSEKWTVVAGLRGDYNNLFGAFVTPRLHAKWNVGKLSTLRFLVGRGQKTANIYADNLGYMASNRIFSIRPSTSKAYGLRPEVSYTAGLSFNQDYELWDQKGSFTIDAYHTSFQNQVVLDLENPAEVKFYNLEHGSTSTSIQVETQYKPHRRVEIRLAYRMNDVQTRYEDVGWRQRAYTARDRFLLNIAFETRSHWKFDFTANVIGSKRIPDSRQAFQNESPSYTLLFAQVTKVFNKNWEVYVGVENLTDFRQKDVIVSAENPFSSTFDASYVWGPIVGRMSYLGFRYKINPTKI